MKEIKGVIFDKDGTLFPSAEFWGPIIEREARMSLSSFKLKKKDEDELVKKIGIVVGADGEGNTYKNGFLFRHDGFFVVNVLKMVYLCIRYRLSPFKVKAIMVGLSHVLGESVDDEFDRLDFSAVRTIFSRLHENGVKIGIVSNDMCASCKNFLIHTGLDQYVSFIRGKDSETKRKPSPMAINEFATKFGLTSDEIAIVGDTKADMDFARKGSVGYTVAILTGCGDEKMLRKLSDKVYPTIDCLLEDEVLFNKRS